MIARPLNEGMNYNNSVNLLTIHYRFTFTTFPGTGFHLHFTLQRITTVYQLYVETKTISTTTLHNYFLHRHLIIIIY